MALCKKLFMSSATAISIRVALGCAFGAMNTATAYNAIGPVAVALFAFVAVTHAHSQLNCYREAACD